MLYYCLKLGLDITNNIATLNSLERKVKNQLSALKYNCVLILVANYNSHSKAVNYILDNFTTIDTLSQDIDFNLPGYANTSKTPLNTVKAKKEEILSKALKELEGFSEKDSLEKFLELKKKLISLKNQVDGSTEVEDPDNYHGSTKETSIKSSKYGTIWFNEERFSSFVADLTKKSGNRYNYLGGCDLVMIPCSSSKLLYEKCHVYRFDDVIMADSNLSLDGFIYKAMEIIRNNKENYVLHEVKGDSYQEIMSNFKDVYGDFLKIYDKNNTTDEIENIKADSERLLEDSSTFLRRLIHGEEIKDAANKISQRIKLIYDFMVVNASIRDVDCLYAEATTKTEQVSRSDMVKKLVQDIEHHLQWKLSDNFFFISYSNKDKLKAELIREKLQKHGAHVWIAPDGIPQGRDYASVIPTTLQMTKNFVLILTEHSAMSKWVLREIDAAINNSNTLLRIILADNFTMEELAEYNNLKFYLNNIQISFRYEDLIQNEEMFAKFMS